MLPVISVVTPSFNQGPFIAETIRSVLAQEGDFYLDYIIIDGGSNDETVEIIRNFEPQAGTYRSSMRWISERDRGQVDALKKGFAMARGTILCWLNSDDTFAGPGVLQQVMQYFNDDPGLELLIGDGYTISREGLQTGIWETERISFRELLFLDYHILQPSSFFRSTVYHPQLLKEEYFCVFDADFFIHLLSKGTKYLKTSDRFSCFRIYPEIKTEKYAWRRLKESMALSRNYSRNYFYYFVSFFFKVYAILIKPWTAHIPVLNLLGYPVYALSYLLITGRVRR